MGPRLRSELEIGMSAASNRAFKTAERGFARVKRAGGGLAKGVGFLTHKWGIFAGMAKDSGRVLGAVAQHLKRIAAVGAVAFAAAIAGATAFARKAILAEGSLEKIRTMLTTAFGKDAEKAFAAAEKLSIKTPFTPEEVARGAIFLKQLKVVNTAGRDLSEWLRLAGDLAGAMGKSYEDAIFAIGYGLQGDSERLKQFGITARDLITAGAQAAASGMGVTTQSAEASERFLGAMEKLISTRFKGGAASLAKTLVGLWSTFRGLADFMWADLSKAGEKATSMFDATKDVLEKLNKTLTEVRESSAWKRFTAHVSESFGRILKAAGAALEDGIPKAVRFASKAMKSISDWMDANWEKTWKKVGNVALDAAEGIIAGMGLVAPVIDAAAQALLFLAKATTIQWQALSRLWKFMGRGTQETVDAADKFARTVAKMKPPDLTAAYSGLGPKGLALVEELRVKLNAPPLKKAQEAAAAAAPAVMPGGIPFDAAAKAWEKQRAAYMLSPQPIIVNVESIYANDERRVGEIAGREIQKQYDRQRRSLAVPG